jgi:hypothetical protein
MNEALSQTCRNPLVTVACFTVLYQNLPGGTEETLKNLSEYRQLWSWGWNPRSNHKAEVINHSFMVFGDSMLIIVHFLFLEESY